ncbi:NAD(P)/FAD-dependent oxidoreductase [Neobacillus niacini]|uniref:NAD(P)/FAD-dependent oxidoreductase n=1 Tax=Neobacillus niacini TaxID=86668 RepID=UPI0021CB2098|nr:FAD-dependent oxidoreductase [Neobacillus niacini]MCM3768684.1 FAD-dependent oxidoreductase [Neobacillus niacini]
MNEKETIVVVGGGYAGINLIHHLRKLFSPRLMKDLDIILVDINNYHFKKVKLFKGIVEDRIHSLKVRLTKYCGDGIQFIQGELTAIDQDRSLIELIGPTGNIQEVPFSCLILALGSVARKVNPSLGGVTLDSMEAAKQIRQDLLTRIQSGDEKVRVAVVGGGITGIETSAEIVSWLKKEALAAGKDPSGVEVILIDNKDRLLSDIPEKVGYQLEKRLNKLGVTVLHQVKADGFKKGMITFNNGSQLDADYCIWTVGLKPHPSLTRFSMPLHENGKLLTDSWYRIKNSKTIYAIGDCVHVVDPLDGRVAGMSCKEAINQAGRLAKIIKADLEGTGSEPHKTYPDLNCIGLGLEDGFVWAQKWGIDFVLSGRLGAKVREYTWNMASLFH